MLQKVCVSAPGKIILHGEHSVVHGRKAIACAVGSRVRVAASVTQNPEPIIVLDMPSVGMKQTLIHCNSLLKDFNQESFDSALKSVEKGCAGILQDSDTTFFVRCALSCIIYAYCKVFSNKNPAGDHASQISLCIASDLPIGAGLGSSAAFNTSVACTFLILSDSISLPNPCNNFSEITNKLDLNKVNAMAFELEKIVHKTPSGIDNSIATFGGAVLFQKGAVDSIDKMPTLQLLIIDTKVPRSTKTLVAKVGNYLETFPSVVSHVLDAIDAIAAEAIILLQKMHESENRDEILKDWGKLIVTNQCLLASIGVSHCELDKICSIASKYGCPAKLTGAGGGGCAIVFLDFLTDGKQAIGLENELFSQGYNCIKASLGGPGVLVKCDM